MCALPTIISYISQCFQRSHTTLTRWIIAMTVASHAVLLYSLNHRAIRAKLLLSIKEKYTVVFSAILMYISLANHCNRVAFTLDSALKVTVCPLTLEGTIVSMFYQVSGFLKLLRLVSNCLSLLCSLCITSIVFWTRMFTNVSEITNSFPQGFSAMTVPLQHD